MKCDTHPIQASTYAGTRARVFGLGIGLLGWW